jgi:hypothetical protein
VWGILVGKTATKRDDYTRLQNLNALFSVIGSVSTQEETVQLQRTLSFMRENDDLQGQMSTRSFEHCIEQVVRFHFPNDRNFHYTHWNARCHTIEPLWVHASVLEFIESFKGSMRGIILVSGIRETLSSGRRWTARKEKEYQELRSYIEDLVVRNARHDQDLSVLFF